MSFASDFFGIVNFEAVYNGEAESSALGVTAHDDKTLVITLSDPNPAFLSTVDIFPCRQSDVEANGDAYGSEAGTVLPCGPFKLDSWVHNSELKFSKNDRYWDRDNVEIDGFSDLVIADEGAQMASLENGSIDFAPVISQEYADKFDKRDDLYKTEITTDRTVMVVFNCQDEVFPNEKVRQAEAMLVTEAAISPVYYNAKRTYAYDYVGGIPLNTFDTTGMKTYSVSKCSCEEQFTGLAAEHPGGDAD